MASHRTAARLHGLDTTPWDPVPIEVTVRKARQPTHSELARIHTSTNLGPDDICRVRGIPTTSIARTIFGLGRPRTRARTGRRPQPRRRRHPRPAGVRRLADLATRAAALPRAQRRQRPRGHPGRARGQGAHRELAGARLPGSARTGRVPAPEGPATRGRSRAVRSPRVDFLYEPKLVIEVSGYASHSTRRQLQADAARRNRLKLAGSRSSSSPTATSRSDPGYVLVTVAEHAGFTVPILTPDLLYPNRF